MASWEVAAGIVITLAAIYLQVLQSHVAGALWRDEVNSVQLANMPTLSLLWRDLEFDSYPALFPLVVRGWSALFSSSDASLRTLGVCIGISLLGSFWIAARSLGARVPLIGLLLLGLNPVVVRFGTSVRGYGLGCTLAVLTVAAVWRVVAADRLEWRKLAVAIMTAVLSVQCLYHNVPLLFATCLAGAIVACWQRRWPLAAVVMAIGLPAALCLLPYLPIIRRTRKWAGLMKYDLTPAWLWAKLCEVIGRPSPLDVFVWTALAALGLGLTVWSTWTVRKTAVPASAASRRLFAAVTFSAGGLIYARFLASVGYITQPWYYLAFLAVTGVCLDGIFGQASARNGGRLFRLTLCMVAAALSIGLSGRLLCVRSTNIDQVAAKLNALARPGDLVMVNRWECAISLHRYYHGPAPLMTMPPMDDHLVHRYDLYLQAMQGADPLPAVFAAFRATLQGGGRVWLVGYPVVPLPGAAIQSLPAVVDEKSIETSYDAYYEGWPMRADQFLDAHSLRSYTIRVATDLPVSHLENPSLGFCEGWQEDVDQTSN